MKKFFTQLTLSLAGTLLIRCIFIGRLIHGTRWAHDYYRNELFSDSSKLLLDLEKFSEFYEKFYHQGNFKELIYEGRSNLREYFNKEIETLSELKQKNFSSDTYYARRLCGSIFKLQSLKNKVQSSAKVLWGAEEKDFRLEIDSLLLVYGKLLNEKYKPYIDFERQETIKNILTKEEYAHIGDDIYLEAV